MTDKFTIRDILAYTMLGMIGLLFYYLHYPDKILDIISKAKDYSDLVVLLFIPISYIIGHLIMSVDDIIFNGILYRIMPKENVMKIRVWRWYNFLFFGYRNIGIRNKEQITSDIFLKTCDELRKADNYSYAEYFQVMSDLFKGIFLVLFASMTLDIFSCSFKIWKLVFLILTWYRAKSFSAYYVRTVKRNIQA